MDWLAMIQDLGLNAQRLQLSSNRRVQLFSKQHSANAGFRPLGGKEPPFII
jgi:hypothetical protein